MVLFATDYDGTLNQKGVSSKTLEAIKAYRKLGHKFGIVTGRPLDLMEPELKLYSIPLDFLIGANGGIIQVNGETLRNSLIEYSVVEEILKLAKVKGIANIGVSNGYKYGNLHAKVSLSPIKFVKYIGYLVKRHNSKAILKNREVTTIFLHDEPNKVAEIYQLVKKLEGVEAYVNNLEYLDIVAKGVSKANAVAIIQEHFQANKAYVIGDSMNDYPMIERYHGFCVENACVDIKNLASKSFKDVGDALSYVMEVNKYEEK